MAKTESTAVNQLIELVQTATPLKPDPTDDLMFKAPKKSGMRMTSTVPAIKAEVPALPRQRAPQGTQRGVPAIDPPGKPSVRMSTAADPVTMPKIQPWASAEGTGEGDVITDVRNQALAQTAPAISEPAFDPRATKPSLPPPLRQSAPPPIPGRVSAAMAIPPVAPAPAPLPPLPAPTPEMSAYPSAAPYLAQLPAPDMTSHQPWFDEQQQVAPVEIDVELGTDRVRAKSTDWKTLIPKLIAPTLGLIIVGMFVGGFLAFDGQGGKKKRSAEVTNKIEIKAEPRAAAPTVAAATPAAKTKAAPETPVEVKAEPKAAAPETKAEVNAAAPTTPPNLAPHAQPATSIRQDATPPVVAGRPKLVDIRLDSKPSGATVTLIDRGKSTFLGTTPINTVVDPSRTYDVVFSHAGKPTQVEHLDPSTTKKLAVVLGKKPDASARKTEVKAEVKKTEATKKVEAPKTEVKKTEEPKGAELKKTEEPKVVDVKKTDEPKEKKAVVDPFETAPKNEAPKGDGVLMVSSKPPCEIVIDGVATGLTTPQRAIKLAAGVHKVTLVNTAEKIKKTVTITVSADQPTKVIENFMK